jgi:hypothetical protein
MKENQKDRTERYSFEQLMSLSGDEQQDYAQWFGDKTVQFAQAAADKIRYISSFQTEADQSEAWGDRFNPEYELRRAAATLIGLEEKLDESLNLLGDHPPVVSAVEEALEKVRQYMEEVKDDFARANGWFVAVDSLFSGSLLE